MDNNQVPKGSQDFDIGQWERTGIQPFQPSPVKMILPGIENSPPNNERSNCTAYFITIPTPWEVKQDGVFLLPSRPRTMQN